MRALACLLLAGGSAALTASCAGRPSLAAVNDFTYWLQKIDARALEASAFDLAVVEPDECAPVRGKITVAYLSIGEAEDYRAYWRKEWAKAPPAWLGPENPDWKGNFKVRFWHEEWRKIVFDALDRILARGYDGVYLDVVDAYEFWKERARMVELVRAISKRARERKALVFVQNAEELLDDYLEAIDGIGREEVYFYRGKRQEHLPVEKRLDAAVAAGKKVLVIEYVSERDRIDWIYARAREKRYVPYVTGVELDEMRVNPGHEPD